MDYCKLAKLTLAIALLGLPLALVFGGGVAFVILVVLGLYLSENENFDK